MTQTSPRSPKMALIIAVVGIAGGCCLLGTAYALNASRGGTSPTTQADSTARTTRESTQAPAATATRTVPAVTQPAPTSAPTGSVGLIVVLTEDPSTPGALYEPVAGEHLVGAYVVIDNQSSGSVSVNPLNVQLADGAGQVYTAEAAASDIQPQLPTLGLLPGERVLGWVFYAIPDAATPSRLTLDSGSGQQLASADFAPNAPAQWTTISPPAAASAETGTYEGYSLTLVQVVDPAPADTLIYTAQPGFRLVATEVNVRNDSGTSPLSINPLNLYLIDDHGFIHTALPGASTLPQIDTLEAAAGTGAQGHVAFEVPEVFFPSYLRYAVNVLDTTQGMMVRIAP